MLSFNTLIAEKISRLTFTDDNDLQHLAKLVKGTPAQIALQNAAYVASREDDSYTLYEIFFIEVFCSGIKEYKALYNTEEKEVYYNGVKIVPDIIISDSKGKIVTFIDIARARTKYKKMFAQSTDINVTDAWGKPADLLVIYVNKSQDFSFDYKFYGEISTPQAILFAQKVLNIEQKL